LPVGSGPSPEGRPCWDGGPLDGKTILLHPELLIGDRPAFQGLGSTLQFIRLGAVLQARGAKVLAEVQPRLMRVLERTPRYRSALARRGQAAALRRARPVL